MNENNEFKPRDGYPVIRYHDSDTQVRIGDQVEFEAGMFFRKEWRKGKIDYVPGLSEINETLEHDRLMLVGVRDSKGHRRGYAVLPDSARLRNTIRFIGRTDDNTG